ncbi:MAG: ABC transporter permease [Herpetosiphon sp.]
MVSYRELIRLYFRLVGARIRGELQYKTSFLFHVLSFALSTVLDWALLAVLLARFQSIGGWSIAEIGLLYGISTVSFGLAEMVGRGFDAPFVVLLQRGAFDGILLRPLGSFFQILGSEFQVLRLGRMGQGLAVLLYALSQLPSTWHPATAILVVLSILSGTVIYVSLLAMGATLCFWTVSTPEVMNVFTFGGNVMTSYPLSIYHRFVRTMFLFVVPVGFINYPAALWILNRAGPADVPRWFAWASPLVAAAFLAVGVRFWQFGVRSYRSSGS